MKKDIENYLIMLKLKRYLKKKVKLYGFAVTVDISILEMKPQKFVQFVRIHKAILKEDVQIIKERFSFFFYFIV